MKINIVLYHPEIAENTGNIIRSAVGFNAKLHLIKPYGFIFDKKRIARACVGYFEHLEYEQYDDFDDFKSKNKGKFYYLTRYGHKGIDKIDFKKDCENEDCYIILGAENEGIAYDILKENLDDCYRIPTTDKVRCLNVSNCAAIMLYLASTALNSEDIIFDHEPDTLKGENFIDNIDLSTLDRHHLEHKH